MKNPLYMILAVLSFVLLCGVFSMPTTGRAGESNDVSALYSPPVKVAVIPCEDMIDDGLYKSIKRRTEIALNNGAQYLIYQIDTYGGDLFAAFDISNYFLHEVNPKAHTVAFVSQKAISAGAMISVACKDIIMKENTTIGDCAPIQLGGKLEGVEREKVETVTRSAFVNAANSNGYPEALLKAMVTIQIEVYKVKNLQTDKYEFFEGDKLPKDPDIYDINDKEIIDRNTELLTLTASQAVDYGVARAQVKDLAGGLEFLAKRDKVTFAENIQTLKTNWSEEMVRWVNSPTVMGVLVMIALLGVYIEFNTPGAVLPAVVAGICFVIIIGSKYLTGMANWLEVAVFITGLLLLAVEVFILPGFGIAGVLGLLCVFAGMFGMLIKNPPDKVPWPETQLDWQLFNNGILAVFLGAAGFVVLAWLFSKYLPKIPIAKRLILAGPVETDAVQYGMASEKPLVGIAQKGITLSQLRPSGIGRFGRERVNVVSRGEFIDENKEIIVESIDGNNIVVKEITGDQSVS
jgi:membrane-bound serine protease (ClpP class)